MRVMGSANSTTVRSSHAPHISIVGAGKVGDEDTVEISVDEDLHGEQGLTVPFHPRK